MRHVAPGEMTTGLMRLGVLAIGLAAMAGSAGAADGLDTKLSGLLGPQREALATVPASGIAALTAPPPAAMRGLRRVPAAISHDDAFLAGLPVADGNAQWECLSEALYFEARGESVPGLFAVAEVILNRVESAQYPDTVCAVIRQGTGRLYACQFTYTCDGHPEVIREHDAYERVSKVARLLLDGAPRALTDGATHYHTRAVNPYWASRFPRTASIGAHHFYRQPTRTAAN